MGLKYSTKFHMKKITYFISSAFLILAYCTSIYAQADKNTFPNRPLTLVVGYTPGGATDIVARALAKEMEKELGQPVVIDNRPGAGTLVATQYVQRAPADGYTLILGTNGLVINSLLQDPPPYDPVKDFQSIGLVTVQSLGLIVRPGLNVNSVKELVAYAKANPGALNFASSGFGNGQHFAGVMFASAAGIDMTHVPFKGAGPAIQELLAGRVDMIFTGLLGLKAYIAEKQMLLIATTGKTRNPTTPNTPTVGEGLGQPNFAVYSWQGVFAPVGIPKAVLSRLNTAVNNSLKSPALSKLLADQGMESRPSTPEAMQEFISKEKVSMGDSVKIMKNEKAR